MDDFEKIADFVYRCKTCGATIEADIVKMANHWAGCSGKEFTNTFVDLAKMNNGKVTEEQLGELHNSHIKDV